MSVGSPEWRTFMSGVALPGGTAEDPPAPTGMGGLPQRHAHVALILAAALALLGMGALGAALVMGSAADRAASGITLELAGEPAAGAPDGMVGGASRAGMGRGEGAVHGIIVDVAGAVVEPGLRRLDQGSRVGDAIAAAGGFGPGVDLEAVALSLNLAEPLSDGQKVVVPALGRRTTPVTAAQPGDARTSQGRIDLNRATRAELESLPGIGPVTAGRILDARATAPFAGVEELRTRDLVSQSVFDRIRGSITVSR